MFVQCAKVFLVATSSLLAVSLDGCQQENSSFSKKLAALKAQQQELTEQERALQDEYQKIVQNYNVVRNHPLLRKSSTTPEQKAEAMAGQVDVLKTQKAELQAALDDLRRQITEYKAKYM